MNRHKVKDFIFKHKDTKFYQPVVFVPKILEIRGKWHESTKDLAELIFNDIQRKSVLDLGCNSGFFLHEAKRKGATKVLGIDHDPIAIKLAIEINSLFGDGSVICQDNVNNYNINAKYDVVLLLNILYIIPDPLYTVNKYLPWTLEKMIIEHDSEINFEKIPHKVNTINSSRSAGHRFLSIITINP